MPEDAASRGTPGEHYQVFPPRATSDSEPEDDFLAAGSPPGRLGNLLDFLQSEEDDDARCKNFYHQLQALKIKNSQSLLELGTLYQAQVEGVAEAEEQNQELERFFRENQSRLNGSKETKRSSHFMRPDSLTGMSADYSENNNHHHSDQNAHLRFKTATLAWTSPITVPKPFNMTLREAQKKANLRASSVLPETSSSWMEQQTLEEAECQRQFRALPVPAHVYLPLYEEMREQNEARRSVEIQKRCEFLVSTQKPFSFVEKEEKKKEIQLKMLATALEPENRKTTVVKKIPKSVQDPTFSDKLREAELYRKIRIQMRAKDLLQKSVAPITLERGRKDAVSSTGLKTQAERLSFLQENLRFQPRTNPQVPDFDSLYRAFQRKVMKTREMKEATRNKPFNLSTSNLRTRPRKSMDGGPKEEEEVHSTMRRSHSLTGLSSLSSNTLPVYITDSTKRRESAIRCSLQEKQSKDIERASWMDTHRKKSQALNKSVTRRAKVLDPHKPLQEVFKEKLKENWRSDQKRTKEYKSELEEMNKRVKDRPFLFEQVTKRDARKGAERRFRSTLQEAGLSEDFVRNKGALDPDTREEELEARDELDDRNPVSASKGLSVSSEDGQESPDQESEDIERKVV
ncbi:hypothetical protein NDU88_001962 [Pleurodeles waltl]|uniref:Protein FAM161B n=1 Tax=Pleurodeles waltl TaxID=8319 RepID=A0AAV7MQ88_PLEWA|nr:hypothetical protein NDU88_001962 [Pleurodeles waltl]